MAKRVSSLELSFNPRPASISLARWLQEELRKAILDGRLRPGTRLPATRDFAEQYSLSRGTIVSVFEQLQAEGYLTCKVGAGTWVNERISSHSPDSKKRPAVVRLLPPPMRGLKFRNPARPFRSHEPALAEFPTEIWARVASWRLKRVSHSLLAGRDIRGYAPLRQSIADYLASSRGVNCSSDQIVIVSGVQQGLDLLSRVLVKGGDEVWMEDPGYFGASIAFRNAGATIIPVPVDDQGFSVSEAKQQSVNARVVYLTPGHQFPLGATLSLERRLEVLGWARDANAFIIEDDYDSEYRFEGRPVPALQGLDKNGTVILIGSFNKLLFPSLRLGYIVAPEALIDPLLDLRFGTDHHPSGLDQAILNDFIAEGHFGRHIRRMRDLYSARLTALVEGSKKYLDGLMEIPSIQAGLYISGLLRNGMSSRDAETAAAARQVESMALDRFTLKRTDIQGLVLGFAAFDETQIAAGLADLAAALEA